VQALQAVRAGPDVPGMQHRGLQQKLEGRRLHRGPERVRGRGGAGDKGAGKVCDLGEVGSFAGANGLANNRTQISQRPGCCVPWPRRPYLFRPSEGKTQFQETSPRRTHETAGLLSARLGPGAHAGNSRRRGLRHTAPRQAKRPEVSRHRHSSQPCQRHAPPSTDFSCGCLGQSSCRRRQGLSWDHIIGCISWVRQPGGHLAGRCHARRGKAGAKHRFLARPPRQGSPSRLPIPV